MHSAVSGFTMGGDGADADYAAALYRYAGGRLDDRSLRSWMAQRLVLDRGLDRLDARLLSAASIEASREHLAA
jgi:hypothetical protein